MTTLHAAAITYLRRQIDHGHSLDSFLRWQPRSVTPAILPAPAIWLYVGGHMFADAVGDHRIRLKPHQIGVTFCWRDGRNEHAIFDARKLWDDIVNPKPVQLCLWPEIEEVA